MRRRLFAGLLLAIAIGGLSPGVAHGAGTVAATGWWSRNPAASAPAGGMAVGFVPDGPATVAAVKLELGNGVTTATLELAEVGGTATDTASVLACETSTTWQPVEKGPIEASPATTCAQGRSVVLTRDAGSLLWSADVSALLAGRTGLASIALVPVASSDGLGSLAFEVQWSGPPTFTSTAVPASTSSKAPTQPASTPRPATATPPPAQPVTAPSTNSVALRLPALSTPTVAAPVAQSPVPTTTTVTTPQLAAQSVPSSPADDDGAPVAQALFFLVVAAVAGTVAGVGRWFVTNR